MKKITKIEYQKNNKNRVNIYLDDSFAFGIDINIMVKYSLSKNMELKEDFIEEILMAEEEINVYNYALSVLSRTFKSEKQLRDKLNEKGYDGQFVDNTIIKLKEKKYLDDERYSEILINNKINISKYGKRRVREALYHKGINREIIDEKLSCISEDDELERALSLGSKKLRTIKKDDERRSVKLSNYLVNKGFEFSTVKKAVVTLLKQECYDFDDLEDF